MAKKAIIVYLKQAISSGFSFIKKKMKSLKELNENFQAQRTWIMETVERKADYKRRLVKVLEIIKMHSCKYLGISYLTDNNLCVAYQEQFGESISRRTVVTCMKHLRELGIISTIATKREDGKQSANIVVIEKLKSKKGTRKYCRKSKDTGVMRVAQQVIPTENKGEEVSKNVTHKEQKNLHTQKTTSPLKTTIKKIKERITKERRLLNFVPQWFKEQVACCSRDAKNVFEYWKVAKHLMSHTFGTLIAEDEKRDVVHAAIREFYLASKAAARGKFQINNLFGFFHAILQAEGYAHIRRQGQAKSMTLYNWLEV